jgi:hypothetical protein
MLLLSRLRCRFIYIQNYCTCKINLDEIKYRPGSTLTNIGGDRFKQHNSQIIPHNASPHFSHLTVHFHAQKLHHTSSVTEVITTLHFCLKHAWNRTFSVTAFIATLHFCREQHANKAHLTELYTRNSHCATFPM